MLPQLHPLNDALRQLLHAQLSLFPPELCQGPPPDRDIPQAEQQRLFYAWREQLVAEAVELDRAWLCENIRGPVRPLPRPYLHCTAFSPCEQLDRRQSAKASQYSAYHKVIRTGVPALMNAISRAYCREDTAILITEDQGRWKQPWSLLQQQLSLAALRNADVILEN